MQSTGDFCHLPLCSLWTVDRVYYYCATYTDSDLGFCHMTQYTAVWTLCKEVDQVYCVISDGDLIAMLWITLQYSLRWGRSSVLRHSLWWIGSSSSSARLCTSQHCPRQHLEWVGSVTSQVQHFYKMQKYNLKIRKIQKMAPRCGVHMSTTRLNTILNLHNPDVALFLNIKIVTFILRIW